MNRLRSFTLSFALASFLLPAGSALAALSSEELAKLAQNPVANLISLPLQNNTNFNTGLGGTQNILNIQPVIPFDIGYDTNLITRTILPVITQPATPATLTTPAQSGVTGLGDLQFSAFISPAIPSKGIIWGVGAIMQAPTHTDSRLGNGHWGFGPTAVALHIDKSSPWVYGALFNVVWAVRSDSDPTYANFLLQPFLNYNFKSGFYLTSAPIMTSQMRNASGQRWTVPVGGGIGKIFHLGKLPINSQVSGYYNAARPDNTPEWQLRVQVQLMFPK
jgi:hypothetical protein